jgi:integrase
VSEPRAQEGLAASCLELTILTAARSGESRGMPWEGEIAGDVWSVPSHRMKRRREHCVPLTAPALAIIEYMRSVRQNDYVFPGDRLRHLGDQKIPQERRVGQIATAASIASPNRSTIMSIAALSMMNGGASNTWSPR